MDVLDPALRAYAVRDMTEVVPGRRYALVHSQTPTRGRTGYVQFIWVTGIVDERVVYPPSQYPTTSLGKGILGESPVITYVPDEKPRWASTYNPCNLSHVFASDAGVWGVAGVYKNRANYLLDVDALRKYAGILINNDL